MERLKTFTDKRGSLTLLEVGQDIPFEVARVFWIHNVPEGQERGQHANTELSEYLVAVSGSFDIWTEDETGRKFVFSFRRLVDSSGNVESNE